MLLVAGVVFRRQVVDVYQYFFPGATVDAADRRTSDEAPVADLDVALPDTGRDEPDAATPTGTDPAIALEPVAAIEAPSAVVDPPGAGPVLVSTLAGSIVALDLDTGEVRDLADLSDRISTGGERGLLGMALDPATDRLYVDYTDRDGDTEIRSWPLADVLAGDPSDADGGGLGDGVLHLSIGQPYRNHNGGHLAFGPDGLLWIGTGDGGSANDPAGLAQDPTTLLGKMLRVRPDPDGGVVAPSDNPDFGDGTRAEIWAIGLRNPWRYSFDRLTDDLWVADVGQNAVEEVTVVDVGAPEPAPVNFGWDLVEGTRAFDGQPSPDLTDPVVEYTHDEGCSITGGHVYRGSAVPSLYGWYLFGDYCGGWIRAVPADDPGTTPVELVASDADGAGPALSFAELEDGELLFLTPAGIARIVAPT